MKDSAQKYYAKKLQSKSDASDRIVNSEFDLSKVKTIHLTGVCGKAMASLAGLLVKAGYTVTGSDESWNPPMSTVLEHLGLSYKPFSVENIKDVDLLIMGNAYSPSNIEAQEARLRKIPQVSSATAYASFFIKNSRSIVVAGTHGKTTTSGLISHLFISSKKSVNVLVGGIIENIQESYYFDSINPEYSVVEGDEYDTAYFDKAPKFLHYKPTIGIITSIEFDHADIYTDMEDYLNAFLFFAGEIPEQGYLLLNDQISTEFVEKIQAVCSAPIYTYGFKESSDIRILNPVVIAEEDLQTFDISFFGELYKDFKVRLFGKYNLENTTTAIAVGLKEGINEIYIKNAIHSFKGTEQRQQIRYRDQNVILMEDFAHHPTAVQCTIAGIKERYPTKRLIAVFEPRSATSRRKDFEIPYSEAFDHADVVVISKPPIRSVDDSSQIMDVDKVVSLIQKRVPHAFVFPTAKEIENFLQSQIASNDVILIMSNGHFDGLVEKMTKFLIDTHVNTGDNRSITI